MDRHTEIWLSQLEWHKAQIESDTPGVMEPIWRVKIDKWDPLLTAAISDALEEIGIPSVQVFSHTLKSNTLRITGQESIDRLNAWHREHEDEFRALANRIHQADQETMVYDHLWAPSYILEENKADPAGEPTKKINMRVTIADRDEAQRLYENLVVMQIPESQLVFEEAGQDGYKVRVLDEGLQVFHEMLESRQHYIHKILPGIARSPLPDREVLAQTDVVDLHTQTRPDGSMQVRAAVSSGGWIPASGARQNDLPLPFEDAGVPSGMGRRLRGVRARS